MRAYKNSDEFSQIQNSFRNISYRSEFKVHEILPSPADATNSLAFAFNVIEPGSERVLAQGNLALLHEPTYQQKWEGNSRIICFLQTPLENDLGIDPFLEEVTWQWLTEGLKLSGASYRALAGTASRIISKYFGTISDRQVLAGVELRASWTPIGVNMSPHARAFCTALASLAGLTPVEGIRTLHRKIG